MNIEVTKKDTARYKEFLRQKLQEYNRPYFEKAGFQDIGIYMTEDHRITAGLAGILRGNWLLVQSLWVEEKLRNKGTGTALLQKAEEIAKAEGCKHVLLDTFEFQAPDFYIKNGYSEVFVYEEHPVTGKHYYLKKDLEP